MQRLRFGMVGGGNRGNIGNSHRIGAQLDGHAVMVAGSFTRNKEQNKIDGAYWSIAEDRIYETYQEMAEAEAAREDGIDFVSIVTPNHTHYAITKCFLENGINVVCEKPFTLTVGEAEELQALAKAKGLEVCITYTYAHYPIMREFRHLIRSGAIGKVLDFVLLYPQDWMIQAVHSDKEHFANWSGKAEFAGSSNVTGLMGTHLYYLIESMIGQSIESVLSDFSYYPEDAELETTSRTFVRLEDGTRGLAWTSNAAIGHDNTMFVQVYGEKGSIEWSNMDMQHLRVAMLNEPVQVLSANRDYLCEDSRKTSRLPTGHAEGFYEAFANIYREFIRHLNDKKKGEVKDPTSYFYPKVESGVGGTRFVQACVDSNRHGNVWVKLSEVK